MVAFNLIERDEGSPHDLAAIRMVFPGTYLFSVPQSGNLVVIAATSYPLPDRKQLGAKAARLEPETPTDLNFSVLLQNLLEEPNHQD